MGDKVNARSVEWISQARFQPFIEEAQGDIDAAWDLYEWNARMAAALSEVVHHVEVLVRNAMIRQLESIHPLEYPWNAGLDEIARVSTKLQGKTARQVTSDDMISQLNLGFWKNLLTDKPVQNEQLWRTSLHRAFGKASRDQVQFAVSELNEIRNRCAHQDSLLGIDPSVEVKKILRLAGWVDPDAANWISHLQRVDEVLLERRIQPQRDTAIIAVNQLDLDVYQIHGVLLLSSERKLAAVTHLGFYCNQQIEGYFPKVLSKEVPAHWNTKYAKVLQKSEDPLQRRLGRAMAFALAKGMNEPHGYQVYLLSNFPSKKKGNVDETSGLTVLTNNSGQPIKHLRKGQGSAFVKRPRYFSLSSLRAAVTTEDLHA